MAVLAGHLSIADFDGASFARFGEGEVLVKTTNNTVLIPASMEGKLGSIGKDRMKVDGESYRDMLIINVHALRLAGLNDHDAVVTAYLRCECALWGLLDPVNPPSKYYCNYNESAFVRIAGVNYGADKKVHCDVEPEDLKEPMVLPADFEACNAVPKVEIQELISFFPSIVCLIAWMFYTRGHHYMKDYEPVYQRVWGLVNRNMSSSRLVLNFEATATMGLHAIYPVLLEKFWVFARKVGVVTGPLAKRYNSAAAGTAIIRVCSAGVHDIMEVVPGVFNRFSKQVKRLAEYEEEMKVDRYSYSANAAYYGVEKKSFDESEFAVIAAIVKALYESFSESMRADEAPSIQKSAALTRVARGAFISGRLIGSTLTRYMKSDAGMRVITDRVEAEEKATTKLLTSPVPVAAGATSGVPTSVLVSRV